MGELLTRGADQPDPAYGGQGYGSAPAPAPAYGGGRAAPAGAGQLRIDELARAIDHRTAADVWHRMRAGEHGVLGRHIYTYDGQVTFEEISGRYDRDGEFRNTVDRYIGDFERLLARSRAVRPDRPYAAELSDVGDRARLSAALTCEWPPALEPRTFRLPQRMAPSSLTGSEGAFFWSCFSAMGHAAETAVATCAFSKT